MRRPSISNSWMRLATAGVTAGLVLLAISTPVGAAGGPTLVKDIDPTGSSYPTELTQVGNTLFFAADDGVHGVELWKSDGTAAGTKMVKDIRPYGRSSNPQNLINVGGTLFFTAVDGKHGRELWKSNGTKAGTVMVKDIVPSCRAGSKDCLGGLLIDSPVAVGSRLFFFNYVCEACPWILKSDLYVSDGTAAGTKQLAAGEDFGVASGVEGAAFNGRFYFVSGSETDAGLYAGLWVSDGTQSGTHALAGSPSADGIGILPASGRNLYFMAFPEGVPQLWKTDGTAVGTKPLTTIGELQSEPRQAVYMAKRLYFDSDYYNAASDQYYAQVWKTDGTAAGTKPILAVPAGGYVLWLTSSGGRLFFTIDSHLWQSDGTAGGTKELGQFGTQDPSNLIAVGGELCFGEMDWSSGTWALWESNGTAAGTYKVHSFVGPTEELQQVSIGSKLFFAADDGTHGVELWSYTL